MRITITPNDALLVVDMQRDFMPGGALPVPDGQSIIPAINEATKRFEKAGSPIFFTRDYHPKDHISFKPYGGVWPPHCIQESPGAMFAKDLYLPPDNRFIISKGTSKEFDAYSGFQGTILHQLLQERGIKRLFFCGVATDFCIRHTALGALHLGYCTLVLENAIKGVFQDSSTKTIEELLENGAIFLTL